MRVPLLAQWKGIIKQGSTYDGLVANIDVTPTLLDLCKVDLPDHFPMDGLSFKPALLGSSDSYRESIFGELGHSRCIKTKEWKYIAVRYPNDIQAKIDKGQIFRGYQGETLPLPYLTRNSHLGHYAAKVNPNYFDADQLYDLQTDPEENENLFKDHPDEVALLKAELMSALKTFPNRPFGEFIE